MLNDALNKIKRSAATAAAVASSTAENNHSSSVQQSHQSLLLNHHHIHHHNHQQQLASQQSLSNSHPLQNNDYGHGHHHHNHHQQITGNFVANANVSQTSNRSLSGGIRFGLETNNNNTTASAAAIATPTPPSSSISLANHHAAGDKRGDNAIDTIASASAALTGTSGGSGNTNSPNMSAMATKGVSPMKKQKLNNNSNSNSSNNALSVASTQNQHDGNASDGIGASGTSSSGTDSSPFFDIHEKLRELYVYLYLKDIQDSQVDNRVSEHRRGWTILVQCVGRSDVMYFEWTGRPALSVRWGLVSLCWTRRFPVVFADKTEKSIVRARDSGGSREPKHCYFKLISWQ